MKTMFNISVYMHAEIDKTEYESIEDFYNAKFKDLGYWYDPKTDTVAITYNYGVKLSIGDVVHLHNIQYSVEWFCFIASDNEADCILEYHLIEE